MPYKFENLDVWKLSIEYVDLIYEIANQLPKSEEYNLKSQIVRAATSIALNIADHNIIRPRLRIFSNTRQEIAYAAEYYSPQRQIVQRKRNGL